MKATIASVGERFGLLQLVGDIMIDLIGPVRLFKGDSATYRLTVTDDEDEPIDITGATIELQVKTAIGGADPAAISKSVGSGITILAQDDDDTLGQADIAVSSADSTLTPGLYWLDVVVTLDGARTHVVAPREFTIADVVNLP